MPDLHSHVKVRLTSRHQPHILEVTPRQLWRLDHTAERTIAEDGSVLYTLRRPSGSNAAARDRAERDGACAGAGAKA